jgi:hypothetical protein
MTLKLMEDQLHVNRKTTDRAVRSDFAQTTSCVKFLAHSLADEQTQHRVTTDEDITLASWWRSAIRLTCPWGSRFFGTFLRDNSREDERFRDIEDIKWKMNSKLIRLSLDSLLCVQVLERSDLCVAIKRELRSR